MEEETGEAQQTATSSPPRHQQQQPPFSLPPSTVPSSNINNNYPNNNNNNNNNNNGQNPNPGFYQNQQQYRHFSPNPNPNPNSSSGMAIGVPAAATSFSSLNSFHHHRFPTTTPTPTQVRPPIHGNQGMGIRGTLGSGAPMRAAGIAMQHQQRPIQSSVRPQTTPSTQSSISQNLQGHGMPRGPAVGSTGSPSPGTSQAHTQPWLSSRPPIPNAPFRAQMNHPQALQHRSHIPHQMHHSVSMPSQRPQPPPAQHLQQPSSTESQQQILKISGTGNQKLVVSSASQPTTIVSAGLNDRTASVEIVETCNRIISKRSIQELVSQIDPTERLDPEVEDILVGIAEDFVESITSSACSLAKHRKSTTLEAKDILLHLDRSWNITLPGFIGDEIKCFKKTSVSDIHKERLAVLKKSVAAGDIVKSSTGQASGSAKGHLAKTEVAQP